ncbi:MAG: ABC transporter permease [Candidatus Omnitrophota bacterium]|nr:MAG: ABC transporter permease [Candidatus Omnitrophota bacterium]
MFTYVLRRLLLMIPVLWGVVTITFFLGRMAPGDPADAMAGQRASEEQRQRIRERYGFDKPLLVQYGVYLLNICKGDLGISYDSHRPVAAIIAERFPNTFRLAFSAMVVAILLGITAGLVSALFPNTFYDRLAMVLSLIGISTPVFWLGLLLMYFVGVRLQWLPPSGFGDGGIRYLILPAIALGTQSVAFLARMTRAGMLEVMNEEYLVTARAKGMREVVVIFKHAFANAVIPIITIVGLDFASYLSGSVLTEKVFSWPGLGRHIVTAIEQRDYPLINGTVLFFALIFILINLIVDLLYAYLDPRIRYES